jgi:two-component system, cell cycle response regulator DivK
MKTRPEIEAAIRAVLTAKTDNFVELVKLARLVPGSDFRNADLSGCDFSGSDLTDFDFSGSNLNGANLDGATIDGVPLSNQSEARQVTAFVSYAMVDTRSEPTLVPALINEVTSAVNSRLKAHRFLLFNEEISSREIIFKKGELDVDFLIMLLSPGWIRSDQCVNEYLSFLELYGDSGRNRIIPIKIARIAEYAGTFDQTRSELWGELNENPNCIWLPIEFTQATRTQQKKMVLSIADRIAHLIEEPQSKRPFWMERVRIKKPAVEAKSEKILIIDDSLSRNIFSNLLQAHGYSTISTGDGVAALRAIRKLSPDLILTEMLLPEISGLELTKWIKEDRELQSIPILAVTGFGLEGDEEKIRNGGCDIYIEKPARIETLLQAVERSLEVK